MADKSGIVRDLESSSASTTAAIGRWLGEHSRAGLIYDLRGPLGAGKTQLVRGLARGLGITETVRSPTFTVCHVYGAGIRGDGIRLYHIDAYRIDDPEELLLHGWDEMTENGVVAVEWGERVEAVLPAERIVLELEHRGPTLRHLHLEATGERQTAVLSALPEEWPGS